MTCPCSAIHSWGMPIPFRPDLTGQTELEDLADEPTPFESKACDSLIGARMWLWSLRELIPDETPF